MAWYSLLPPQLTTYETWIVRGFLVLAIINLAPWTIAILYDILYYICRRVWHEVPIWGGRAHGERRPRAPTLRDRTRPRVALAEKMMGASGDAPSGGEGEGEEERDDDGRSGSKRADEGDEDETRI